MSVSIIFHTQTLCLRHRRFSNAQQKTSQMTTSTELILPTLALLVREDAWFHFLIFKIQMRITKHLLTSPSDIWAIGVMTYELLNGMPPFTRNDRQVWIWKIIPRAPI